ncbi:Suppressor of tumorigenicity 14 protein-like [Homarus americanus]|uniref:Suppressor of tumorigenicity 14 protein-like n=1 Tax=Homarus americanus TaxID=6706 RepID=A0A8J5MSH4_HOMAM|nr:Suppressor of tumorigenicity 14 protein-like [Homarus americanus]
MTRQSAPSTQTHQPRVIQSQGRSRPKELVNMGGSGGCSGGAPLGFGSLGAGTVRILVGALVVFVVVIVVSLVVFWQAGCPKGGFQCSDGKCLPRSRWCNAEVDCDDQEDELEDECCEYYLL